MDVYVYICIYMLLVDIHIVQVDESLDTLENEVLHRFISFNVKLYGSNQNVNCFRFGANINCFTQKKKTKIKNSMIIFFYANLILPCSFMRVSFSYSLHSHVHVILFQVSKKGSYIFMLHTMNHIKKINSSLYISIVEIMS